MLQGSLEWGMFFANSSQISECRRFSYRPPKWSIGWGATCTPSQWCNAHLWTDCTETGQHSSILSSFYMWNNFCLTVPHFHQDTSSLPLNHCWQWQPWCCTFPMVTVSIFPTVVWGWLVESAMPQKWHIYQIPGSICWAPSWLSSEGLLLWSWENSSDPCKRHFHITLHLLHNNSEYVQQLCAISQSRSWFCNLCLH